MAELSGRQASCLVFRRTNYIGIQMVLPMLRWSFYIDPSKYVVWEWWPAGPYFVRSRWSCSCYAGHTQPCHLLFWPQIIKTNFLNKYFYLWIKICSYPSDWKVKYNKYDVVALNKPAIYLLNVWLCIQVTRTWLHGLLCDVWYKPTEHWNKSHLGKHSQQMNVCQSTGLLCHRGQWRSCEVSMETGLSYFSRYMDGRSAQTVWAIRRS